MIPSPEGTERTVTEATKARQFVDNANDAVQGGAIDDQARPC